ncbi:MAG: hypothetical protein HY515_01265 [Candidatus Aenigmarchaeota archaeon]|nr:hypothetical protein [Candidatus Aenigmarchaeota archaeon]
MLNGKFAVFALSCIIFLSTASAHVEHAEPAVDKGSFWYRVFLWHDWLHPVFFILLIYSCYYFRFFSGRKISGEPTACFGACSHCYQEENWLKKNHRWIFWITLILLFIHMGEIMPSLSGFIGYSGFNFWILAIEAAYLILALLYLMTCYHFRYFVERLTKRKLVSYRIYNGLTALNNKYHGTFLWLTLSAVAIRFALVVLDTGSVLQGIPGAF